MLANLFARMIGYSLSHVIDLSRCEPVSNKFFVRNLFATPDFETCSKHVREHVSNKIDPMDFGLS